MDEDEKQQCVSRIISIIKELSVWKNDAIAIAGVDGAQLPKSWLDVVRNPHEFTPVTPRKNCIDLGMDCSTFVFCHSDLGPYNIIVNPEQKNVVGIIDREIAGYIPLDWIRTKFGVSWAMDFAWNGVGSEDPLLREWRDRVEPQLEREGYPEVIMAWKNWFNKRIALVGS